MGREGEHEQGAQRRGTSGGQPTSFSYTETAEKTANIPECGRGIVRPFPVSAVALTEDPPLAEREASGVPS